MVGARLQHIFNNDRYEEQFINLTTLNVDALMQQKTNIVHLKYMLSKVLNKNV